MSETYVLGIDAGGTHTDAVLLACDAAAEELAPDEIGAEGLGAEALPSARLVASAKARTRHDNLPASVREVLAALATAAPGCDFGAISRVTLGATLAVNALVQDRADPVGLVLSAGPGLDPHHFAMGAHVCIVPGGLDHRGVEVSPLRTAFLPTAVREWEAAGVAAVACVGKFSPRNAAHELAMAERFAGELEQQLGGRGGVPVPLAPARAIVPGQGSAAGGMGAMPAPGTGIPGLGGAVLPSAGVPVPSVPAAAVPGLPGTQGMHTVVIHEPAPEPAAPPTPDASPAPEPVAAEADASAAPANPDPASVPAADATPP